MKLTASTIATASTSTRTNSLTELDTARGWSWTCAQLDADRQLVARCCRMVACSASPSSMMSPPLAIDTPSAITSLPWWRTFTAGGST